MTDNPPVGALRKHAGGMFFSLSKNASSRYARAGVLVVSKKK